MARDMRPVRLEEIEAKMSPEQRARVDKLTAEMRAEEMSLAQLRKARAMTQTALARKLGKTQALVSRIESAGDLYISTLRKQVEALGGALDIRASFPDMAAVSIAGFNELAPQARLDAPVVLNVRAPNVSIGKVLKSGKAPKGVAGAKGVKMTAQRPSMGKVRTKQVRRSAAKAG